MEITIRQARLADLMKLQEIAQKTFVETFAEMNSSENMANYLAERMSPAQFHSEVENPESEFYLAWHGLEVVGYLKVNQGSAQTEPLEEALEIERIYVLASFHGRAIGQALYEKALDIARSKGVRTVWLGVWERNARAIRFYEKNGFTIFGKHIFRFGDEDQTDLMMRKSMRDGV